MLAPILLVSLILALVHPESIPLRANKNKVLEAQLCKMAQPSPKPQKLKQIWIQPQNEDDMKNKTNLKNERALYPKFSPLLIIRPLYK